MAREESDREDILREATGLPDRAELILQDFSQPVVFGFRRSGAVSLFVSQDEVYQFDPAGLWRRAFLSGRLLKAEDGHLIELTRHRTTHETILQRRTLASEEELRLLDQLQRRLQALQRQLGDEAACRLVGQVTSDQSDVVARFRTWLDQTLARPIHIANRPGLQA